MTKELWKDVEKTGLFSINEAWGDHLLMHQSIIFALIKFRKYIGKSVIIHCGYQERTTGGWHPKGYAVDVDVFGMHVVDMYLAAERFDEFNGIGLYPWWHNPGLHLDTRPRDKTSIDSRWGSVSSGRYVPLDKTFIQAIE